MALVRSAAEDERVRGAHCVRNMLQLSSASETRRSSILHLRGVWGMSFQSCYISSLKHHIQEVVVYESSLPGVAFAVSDTTSRRVSWKLVGHHRKVTLAIA